mgnify:CR=1 FL=1
MKVEQKFILSIKEATFELTKEEAEELYIPFQNPIRDYNTPVTCKDIRITEKPNTDYNPVPFWYSTTCQDSVK